MTISNIINKLNVASPLLSILKEKNSVALVHLSGSLSSILLTQLMEAVDRPWIIALPQREEAESVAEELSALGVRAVFFPGGDEEPDSPLIVNPRRAGQQMQVVRDTLSQDVKAVVLSARGLAHAFPSPQWFESESIRLARGFQGDFYSLIEKLINFGYNRESMVERPGEISVRGGILDIFPFTGEEPVRAEFWGDEVESLRTFDVTTQRSTGACDELCLIPSPLSWKKREHSLFDFFKNSPLMFIQDPDLILGEVRKIEKEHGVRFSVETLEQMIEQRQKVVHHTLAHPKHAVDMGGSPPRALGQSAREVRASLDELSQICHDIVITCQQSAQRERIIEFLDLDDRPLAGVSVIKSPLTRGFLLQKANFALMTDGDLFGRHAAPRRKPRFSLGQPLRELSTLARGDFVVHVDHGIGVFRGLEKITVGDQVRECLAIEYKEEDKLYVPVDKMERVQKYSGKEGAQPTLSKLGSAQWDRVKARTKKAIKDIAKDLIKIYSQRQARPGYAFGPDTPWQRELEAAFPYDETPDQAKAIEAVRQDMEDARPMDRLICGDVGFGKTEVAVRAAFKAVSGSKQVAVLVPTTILAQQHYRTFRKRLARFPVTVEVLSRFRSRKQQADIVREVKEGRVDIIIGTHRLLSKDIAFKDLGLLIIDEEQRFGVTHKERLKTFRTTVDVLTMSATPIPRTLQLSMAGIRDMSLINTPPRDRHPIHTEVAVFHEEVVVEAMNRELGRGGQVFFVHNRVKSIHAVARMLQRLVPTAKIAVAHGQMESRDLESVMVDFVDRKYDCLVSTMIIESGLDMPNVNTLVVHRADRMGLGQLYQLRGRVGRSETQAYAYLLTPPFDLLSAEAIKRLRTVEEFTELGSGIQIAMRDLEIRGAGNLLGMQQSGNIDAVGFDLYNKLVSEAVEEIKAEQDEAPVSPSREVECRIDYDGAALLPKDYVPDESQRVDLYRRLASFHNIVEIDGFQEELRDRFGPLPRESELLVDLARIRVLAQALFFKRLIFTKKALRIFFDNAWPDQFASQELFSRKLRSMIDLSPVPVKFMRDKAFGVNVHLPLEPPLAFAKKILQSWQ